MGHEMPVGYYDEKIPKGVEPGWIYLYNVVSGILKNYPVETQILDVGCGPGRLAPYVPESQYSGIDWSANCIDIARTKHPLHKFNVTNMFEADFDSPDVLVFLEVLEHIGKDIELLKRIPEGKHVIISVPNTDDESHVRFFPSVGDVIDRYRPLLGFCFFGGMAVNARGKMFWLIHGIRKGSL